jgi:hypothetical protein
MHTPSHYTLLTLTLTHIIIIFIFTLFFLRSGLVRHPRPFGSQLGSQEITCGHDLPETHQTHKAVRSSAPAGAHLLTLARTHTCTRAYLDRCQTAHISNTRARRQWLVFARSTSLQTRLFHSIAAGLHCVPIKTRTHSLSSRSQARHARCSSCDAANIFRMALRS